MLLQRVSKHWLGGNYYVFGITHVLYEYEYVHRTTPALAEYRSGAIYTASMCYDTSCLMVRVHSFVLVGRLRLLPGT